MEKAVNTINGLYQDLKCNIQFKNENNITLMSEKEQGRGKEIEFWLVLYTNPKFTSQGGLDGTFFWS